MTAPEKIVQSKLLLVEGVDEKNFFIALCAEFSLKDIQIVSFGGISNLEPYLKLLPSLEGYEGIKSIVIVRDAEKDPDKAVNHVKKSLKKANLPVAAKPFEYAKSVISIAFMISPGFVKNANGKNVLCAGTLENLCLDIVKDNSTFDCVDKYIECIKSKGQKVKRLHKTKLHTYLSGKDNFVGLKIGEASKAGAWNWNHDNLKPFIDVIKTM